MSDAELPFARSEPEAFREQIRDYLRERQADGLDHVTAAKIADEFDVPIQKVSTNLGPLLDDGTLSVWAENNPGNANTYVLEDV